MVFSGCVKENEKQEIKSTETNSVFTQILPQVMDTLSGEFDLENRTLVHHEFNQHKLKDLIIKVTLDSLEQDKSLQVELLRKLSNIINDSVIFEDLNLSRKKYNIVYKREEVELLLEQNDSLHILNLSPIAFNKRKDVGCFYFAIDCGDGCGKGYFIYILKERNWRILEMFTIWHG